MLDDVGLDYICTTAERFFVVGRVLGNMVAALAEQPLSRLLKHIIQCYLRLSDNPRLVKKIAIPVLKLCSHILLLRRFLLSQFFFLREMFFDFYVAGLVMHLEVAFRTC